MHEPTVHTSEAKCTVFRTGFGLGVILEHPCPLASADERRKRKAGLQANGTCVRFQPPADRGRPNTLPADRIGNWLAGLSIPRNGCLALIGDPHSSDRVSGLCREGNTFGCYL